MSSSRRSTRRPEGAPPDAPAHRIRDLASLLAPASVDALVEAFSGKQRLLVRSSHPRRAEALLPRWMLDRMIAADLPRAGAFQVLRHGEVIPPERFRDADGRLRSDALAALVAEGVSFILHRIDDEVPAIGRLADSVERRLGHAVWVNAYITHGSGGALPPHYDDHDVLVLQVHGKKRWFGHGTPEPSPIARSPDGHEFGPARWDLLLEPGDALFVPRGEVHHTEVDGDLSVHLTLAIDTLRGVDLLTELRARAAREPLFREDLTRLTGSPPSGTLHAHERRLKDRLHALVDELDLEQLLLRDDRARPLRAAESGPRPDCTHAPRASVVVPRLRRAFTAPLGGELVIGGEPRRLSPGAQTALALLVARDHTTLGALLAECASQQATDEASVRAAVNELVRLGLAEVDWAPPDAT